MAITTPRRRPKNPEGRMSLSEHLRELRSRMFRAGLAVALGAVAGWFLYDPLIKALMEPLVRIAHDRGGVATLNYAQVASPFNLKLKLSVYLGVAVASPVWLYQLWAFVVPGLTKREKRYAIGFVAAGAPLFAAGLGLAWLVMPNAVRFLTEFTPKGAANIISADEYLTFVTQIFLAFGIAFVVPVLLVGLNLVGVLSGAALAKGWRIAVFLVFLFAAVASPPRTPGRCSRWPSRWWGSTCSPSVSACCTTVAVAAAVAMPSPTSTTTRPVPSTSRRRRPTTLRTPGTRERARTAFYPPRGDQ